MFTNIYGRVHMLESALNSLEQRSRRRTQGMRRAHLVALFCRATDVLQAIAWQEEVALCSYGGVICANGRVTLAFCAASRQQKHFELH